MWDSNTFDENAQTFKLSDFGGGIISGSSKDMHCQLHSSFDPECNGCKEGKALVEKFQSHRHTFTCKTKGKIIKILSGEGHGRRDGEVEDEILLVPVCQFYHPKNPIDNSEFLLAFPESFDETEWKKAKDDYSRIRICLL